MTTSPVTDAREPRPVRLPTERGCPFDPPSELGELRDNQPMSRLYFPDGSIGWLVTSYELARAVLGDQRFSAYPGGVPQMQSTRAAVLFDGIQRDTTFPQGARAVVERYDKDGQLAAAFRDPEVLRTLREHPLRNLHIATLMDPPAHTQLRRVLASHFSVRRVGEHRTRIEQIVQDRLDVMERLGPPVDLVETFTRPIPSLMTCVLYGVPESERGTFEQLTAEVNTPNSTVDRTLEAMAEFRAFAGELIDRKRAQPSDDLLSTLIHDGKLTDEELVSVTINLVRGSHSTTSTALAFAVLTLLRDRDRWNVLRSESVAIDQIVEELLRYDTITQLADVRTALADVELGGTVIKAFETVVISNSAVNRDPQVFADPDRVDLTRPSAAKHLAFGYGIHQCIGQNLARLELQIALTGLARRFPTLELAVPIDDVPWRSGDEVLFGPQQVPVTW